MSAVEFVEADDEDGREPGTYVTIRVDDETRSWRAGRVVIEYTDETQ